MSEKDTLVVRKYLPVNDDGEAKFTEGPLSETVASCYFHIGNGGVTFSVQDMRDRTEEERDEGVPYQSAEPMLCVSFHREANASIRLPVSTEGLRELAFQLLKASQHEYRGIEPAHPDASSPVEVDRYGGHSWKHGGEEKKRYMDFIFTGEKLQERRKLLEQEEKLLSALEALHAQHATSDDPTESVEVTTEGFAGQGPRRDVEKISAMMEGRKYVEPEPVPYPNL